jgi:hypothetical protein
LRLKLFFIIPSQKIKSFLTENIKSLFFDVLLIFLTKKQPEITKMVFARK